MLQILADGLIIGSVVSLGAIGLSLTFSILRFSNFGHGELLAWGAYFALTLLSVFSAVGGAGMSLDQPLQRMWRDANMIARHISLNWDAVSSMVGQFHLGLEPKGQY